MTFPAEFDEVVVGLEAVPMPGQHPQAAAETQTVEEQLDSRAVAEAAVLAMVPQARQAPTMGPEATDLPPLPAPDLPELGPGAAGSEARDLRLLSEVQVELSVEIGRVKLPLRDLLGLGPGVVLELDRAADAPVDVLVNGCLVARGEVVVIDGSFGVRITAVVER